MQLTFGDGGAPPTQVPPMPHYLALECANILVLLGLVYERAAMFIAYAGLSKISEALALHWSNCFRAASSWALVLGKKNLAQTKKWLSQAAQH